MAGSIMTGTVKGYEIGKNREGSQNVLLLQVEISGPDDIQQVEYMSGIGDNSIPVEGSIVTIIQAGRGWKIAVAYNDGKDFDSNISAGEKKLYAVENGVIKSFINILKDGNIELNGNANFAVSYNDLETAINNLVSSINSAIAGAITGHTHVETGTTTAPGVGSAPSVTSDISASKVDEVKLP
jgi:phage gp45-like